MCTASTCERTTALAPWALLRHDGAPWAQAHDGSRSGSSPGRATRHYIHEFWRWQADSVATRAAGRASVDDEACAPRAAALASAERETADRSHRRAGRTRSIAAQPQGPRVCTAVLAPLCNSSKYCTVSHPRRELAREIRSRGKSGIIRAIRPPARRPRGPGARSIARRPGYRVNDIVQKVRTVALETGHNARPSGRAVGAATGGARPH